MMICECELCELVNSEHCYHIRRRHRHILVAFKDALAKRD